MLRIDCQEIRAIKFTRSEIKFHDDSGGQSNDYLVQGKRRVLNNDQNNGFLLYYVERSAKLSTTEVGPMTVKVGLVPTPEYVLNRFVYIQVMDTSPPA